MLSRESEPEPIVFKSQKPEPAENRSAPQHSMAIHTQFQNNLNFHISQMEQMQPNRNWNRLGVYAGNSDCIWDNVLTIQNQRKLLLSPFPQPTSIMVQALLINTLPVRMYCKIIHNEENQLIITYFGN